jgi:hypothetical protein
VTEGNVRTGPTSRKAKGGRGMWRPDRDDTATHTPLHVDISRTLDADSFGAGMNLRKQV